VAAAAVFVRVPSLGNAEQGGVLGHPSSNFLTRHGARANLRFVSEGTRVCLLGHRAEMHIRRVIQEVVLEFAYFRVVTASWSYWIEGELIYGEEEEGASWGSRVRV